MKTAPFIAIACFTIASCDRSSTPPAEPAAAENTEPHGPPKPDDGSQEAHVQADAVRLEVDAALPSYYRTGEPTLQLQPMQAGTRRGVMLLPIIATEDLFVATGETLAGRPVVEPSTRKDEAAEIRYRFDGYTNPYDGWRWSETLEVDPLSAAEAKPLSTFPRAVIKGTDDHLVLIKSESERREKEEAELAAKKAEARARVVEPLAAAIKPGGKSEARLPDKVITGLVVEADAAKARWTLRFTDRFSSTDVVYSYDESLEQVVATSVVGGGYFDGTNLEMNSDEVVLKRAGQAVTVTGFRFK